MLKNDLTTQFIEQLSLIIKKYESVKNQSSNRDISDIGFQKAYDLIVKSRAAIERISGSKSVYTRQIEDILNIERRHDFDKLNMIIGVVESLRDDLQAGYLSSFPELIHGEIFADFLEMAQYLLDEGFKDAAAVIVGGTIEAQLRQLCIKNNIEVIINTGKGIQSKKAEQMNEDLAKGSFISKLDQKNVTAWLDLRNKAAHARYDEYTKEQVALLITGIRDSITRNPA